PLEIQKDPDFKDKAQMALEKVGLKDRMTHFPHQLSRGECQRVAVARVLALRPSLILADEPTGSLDQKNAEVIMDLILNLIHDIEGSSLLLVTHDAQLSEMCEMRFHFQERQLLLEKA
ncbi:MAG: ATP-binding cassette domain-containing protein, partial [Bdellovibrionales bacterium]|nr:ATP-binding cassette domain-containing protein [Bdellovibrionales bacterium]